MGTFAGWIAREKSRAKRSTVMIEEALLTGSFLPYAWYRLRFFALTQGWILALHLCEFLFLYRIFADRGMATVLVVQNVASVAGSFWWGALEVLRNRVRELAEENQKQQISALVGQWVSRAVAVAAALIGLGLGVAIARCVRAQDTFSVFDLFVFVVCFRLGCDLVTKTLHSSVFALRRIYRPLYANLSTELVGLGIILLVWPVLGPWSYSLSILGVCIFSTAISARFTLRAYRRTRLPEFRLSARGIWPRPSRAEAREFLEAGLAYAISRMGAIITLVFSRLPVLFVGFHVISPLVGVATSWAQIFYFDLKRMEQTVYAHFQPELRAFMRRLSWLMGILPWVVAAVVQACFQTRWTLLGSLAALAFFASRSFLSALQIQFFSARRYRVLIGSAAVIFAACAALAMAHVSSQAVVQGVLAAGFVLSSLVLRSFKLRNASRELLSSELPILEWVKQASAAGAPARIGMIEVERGDMNTGYTQIADQMISLLQGRGGVSLLNRAKLVWFERPRDGDWLPIEQVVEAYSGLLKELQWTRAQGDGSRAFLEAESLGFFAPLTAASAAAAPDAQALAKRFREEFPGGIVIDLANRAETKRISDLLSVDEIRAIFRTAVDFARGSAAGGKSREYDVSAYSPSGDIHLIFLQPLRLDPKARNAWKESLRALNWRASIAQATPGK